MTGPSSAPSRRTLAARAALLAACLALPGACSDDGGGDGGGTPDGVAPADAAGAAADADAAGPDERQDDHCCPAGVCPLGEICLDDACHPAPGSSGCYVDGECAAGQTCEGEAICTCEDGPACDASAGACTWPAGCCNATADCAPGETCLLGVCQTKPADASQCWHDGHCKPGQECQQVAACSCTDTGCDSAPGICSLPGACCLSDSECGANGRCVGNRCVPTPTGSACYADEGCPGSSRCAGAFVCPCGDDTCLIPTTPGVCVLGEVCCQDAGECPPTAVCVEGKSCVNAPGGDQCFLDGHCGPGRLCEGASVCACGELCPGGSDVAGHCETPTLSCQGSDDCPGGMRCVIPDTWHCPGDPTPSSGVCVEQVDKGCWQAGDCGPGQRCVGELICTKASGCSEPNHPGTCNLPGDDDNCCDSHLDCGPDLTCRNSNTTVTCPPNPTAVCLPDPKYGEQCWNYLDCGPGDVCNFSFVCACSARCAKSHMGFCGSPIGQPCKTSIDCGSGYACAKDEECMINPCFDGTFDCAIGGLCQPDLPDQCWSQFQCGADEYCAGLQVCPVNTQCSVPDVPGVCTPLRAAGECCDSWYACELGLRCVSAVTKSACTIDVSSVCVPKTDDKVSCFSDEDCDPSRTCVGAQVCACELQGCDSPPIAGICELKAPE